ncbi:hypothetical protein [Brenneria salicis]|uniref:hypothetical protein n=1 Tax=Brenneria salicis TaxID=55214 RepID=UPI000F201E52|nr:hypothetical protein [Brenneria salicis]RLM26824.1 hypothetical protein BHG07_18130 [Brenneria salicis ATCC 15712 = DSM 30166]
MFAFLLPFCSANTLIAVFITILFTSQTNGSGGGFFGKKLVDANRSYTNNAPRNADEASAKKSAT